MPPDEEVFIAEGRKKYPCKRCRTREALSLVLQLQPFGHNHGFCLVVQKHLGKSMALCYFAQGVIF